MAEKLVLIHGWSDCSKSFEKLKESLLNLFPADHIYFVDYESREDNMSFDDVVDGLRDKLIERKLIKNDNTVDAGNELNIIVHSTGGLVIRDFISRFYQRKLKKCPIKRVIMLAPANFGSPLAHLGKSTLGSFAAGRKELGSFLETGRQILTGLELASPYQWELAERDVVHEEKFYSAETIQTTVLVGLGQYKDIKQVVNKPGTDGTVVIAGTNLNTVRFTFNFSEGQHDFDRKQTISDIAFGVFDGLNHSTIVDHASDSSTDVHKTIVNALQANSAKDFQVNQLNLKELTKASYKSAKEPQYQQFVVRVTDDFGKPVNDYRIEFFVSKRNQVKEKKRSLLGVLNLVGLSDSLKSKSDEISYLICSEFYQHSQNKSYRRFLVDNEKVREALIKASKEANEELLLSIKLHLPRVDRGIRYNLNGLENIVIYDPLKKAQGQPDIFYPNTTTLLEFKVNRCNSYVHVDTKASTQDDREARYIKSVSG